MPIQVTEKQFMAYHRVQIGGKWNMFDPRARQATGLSKEVYFAIMKQYSELADKYLTKDKSDG